MAKDRTETSAERAERKAAKAAKKAAKAGGDDAEATLHKKVESDGVQKPKKDKHKHKKTTEEAVVKEATNGEKVSKKTVENGDVQLEGLAVIDVDGDKSMTTAGARERKVRPTGQLVTFADPLADEKSLKKLLKVVERAAKAKTLKRGVKEVNKAIKYTPSKFASPPEAICIIAGDISPMDVISHIPVFCEKHFLPYVFVPSRDKLGAAGLTTRPTSVVLVCRETKNLPAEEKAAWEEEYKSLCKAVEKVPRRTPIV